MWLDHLLSREIEVISYEILKLASIPRSSTDEVYNILLNHFGYKQRLEFNKYRLRYSIFSVYGVEPEPAYESKTGRAQHYAVPL